MLDSEQRAALRVVLPYTIVAVSWILFSDAALLRLSVTAALINQLQSTKGLLFVVVTASLLFGLLLGELRRRRAVEDTLRVSETRFRAFFEHAPVYCYLVAPNGLILDVNAAACAALGYTRAELVDTPVSRLYAPAARARAQAAFERWRDTGQVLDEELVLQTRAGVERVVLHSAETMRDAAGRSLYAISVQRDVTDQTRTEAALRASEQRLARLVETVPEGIVIVDAAGQITFANAAAEQLLGLTRSALAGRKYDDPAWRITAVDGGPFPPEALPFVRVMATGQAVYGVEHAIERDGRRVILAINAAPLDAPGGALTGIVAAISDVTARRTAEAEVAAARDRLANVLNSITDAFITLDFEWRITYVNAEAARLNQKQPAEFLGKTHWEEWPASVGTEVERQYRAAMTDRVAVHFEHHYYVARQYDLWLSIHAYPTDDGLAVYYHEITERKRAEAALQRSEQVLRLFVEHSPAAIAMLDRDLNYIVASRRYLADYGLGDQSLAGRSHYAVFPEIPERWRAIHRRCLAGATERADEDPFPRADGRLDWVRWEMRPWYEADGGIGGVILFSEVITDRLNAQAALRQLNAELEQRVAERTAELKAQYQRQAALEERQRLARDLHDVVSQTLFSASVIAETLPRLWDRNPPRVRQGLDELHRLTRGALAEMRALLLELRPESLTQTNLADLVQQLAGALAGRTDLEVVVRTEPPPALPGEVRLGLYRMAQEALNNVVKHARARRVKITLTSPAKDGVRLGIRDDGQGFDPAAVTPGRLGLSILSERAAAIGAALDVVSAPGAGTDVRITWPAPVRPAP
ncbi:MAG: PAS domain S-box protein [Anaerolineales bacterium]|nr:PAS domain S-box protein [Anaerolineales bacterium]